MATFLIIYLINSLNILFFRIIQRNKIKSITKKAFEGLEELEHLWVKPLHTTLLYWCLRRISGYCWMIKDSTRIFSFTTVLLLLSYACEMGWSNHIVGVSYPYFCPLCRDLSKNGIMSIHPEALSHMKLKVLWVDTKWISALISTFGSYQFPVILVSLYDLTILLSLKGNYNN